MQLQGCADHARQENHETQQDIKLRNTAVNDESRRKVRVVYSTQDIFKGFTISSEQLEEGLANESAVQHALKPASSIPEVIGRAPRRAIPSGNIVYQSDLKVPSVPGKGEAWLVSFSKAELSKHIGQRVSLKGHWLAGLDRGYGIISYDGQVEVFFNPPSARMSDGSHGWSGLVENQCVIVSGILRQSANYGTGSHNSKFKTRYFLDPNSLVVKPSEW